MNSVGFLSNLKYSGVLQQQMSRGNLSRMGWKHSLTNGTSGTAIESIGLIPVCGNFAEDSATVYCCCCILQGMERKKKKKKVPATITHSIVFACAIEE